MLGRTQRRLEDVPAGRTRAVGYWIAAIASEQLAGAFDGHGDVAELHLVGPDWLLKPALVGEHVRLVR